MGKINDGSVSDVAVAGGLLWVAVEEDGGVWKVDRDGGVLGQVETGALPSSLVAVDGAVFASNANGGTVTRIDAATDATRQIETGHLLPVLRHRSGLAPPDAVGRQANGS